MKVQTLIEALQKMNPEEEICVLLYSKDQFDYAEDDEVELTTEAWNKICQDFDEVPFADIWESISMAVNDEATERAIDPSLDTEDIPSGVNFAIMMDNFQRLVRIGNDD